MRPEPEETRAQIARRRLAQLTEAFEAEFAPTQDPDELDDPDALVERPAAFRWRPVHLRVVGVIAAAGAVLLVWWLLSARPHETPPAQPVAVASPSPETSGAAPSAELVVDVVGKVKHPGIVVLPPGSRVHDAIEAAGGFEGNVDAPSINLARLLSDGEQLLVGIDPVALTPGSGPPAGAPLIRLNVATADQLESLPGVGPVTARAILAWRGTNGRFTSIDDLLDVKGIGAATLETLRELVTL